MQEERVGRRIFQTWKSRTDIPPHFRTWRQTIIEKNPEFEFTLWDDNDNRSFVAREAPWFLPTYDKFPEEIFRADCIRYFHLYAFGGFYIDMDTECLRPLDKIADRHGVVLGRMGKDPHFEHAIPNAIMASSPREEFWLLVIGMIWLLARLVTRPYPEVATGPAVLKSAADMYLARESLLTKLLINFVRDALPAHLAPKPARSEISFLDPDEWFPLDWSNTEHQPIRERVGAGGILSADEKARLFPRASLLTYWSHSW